jgi:hypothetical protein
MIHLLYIASVVFNLHYQFASRFPYRQVGRDNADGIATRYELEGQGSNPDGGRDFPHLPRPALGPNQPLMQ